MRIRTNTRTGDTTQPLRGPGVRVPQPREPEHLGVSPDDAEAPTRQLRRQPSTGGGVGWLLTAAMVGSLAAVGLGVYGRTHEPQVVAINVAGFSSGLSVKAWLASVAFVLVLVQMGTAIAMYRRRRPPGSRPAAWVPAAHRWSGRVAVLVTVPVAVHCLYALGFQGSDTRTLVHSVVGCFFYGAFVTKMLVLQRPRSPRWALPLLGGTVFTAMTVVWFSSAVWFFSTSGLIF